MGFGAVNRGDLDTYFSGRYLVFQGGISEGENSKITEGKNLSSNERLETVLMTEKDDRVC